MRQLFLLPLARCFYALLLLSGSPDARAEDACPSLSGCAYQAGKGLPGREEAARQVAPPEKPPAIINSCDAGGCMDTDARRYNGRTDPENGVFLDPQGRRCVRSGNLLQCD